MPVSALPPGFNNTQHGDWANIWPFKYIRPSWTAFGPRASQWWAKWREYPIVLFAYFGKGDARWEESNGAFAVRAPNHTIWFYNPGNFGPMYLSAIQYWCDWHVQLQWPLFFAFHWKTKTRVWYFRIGARRNADRFYDFPSAHFGDFN